MMRDRGGGLQSMFLLVFFVALVGFFSERRRVLHLLLSSLISHLIVFHYSFFSHASTPSFLLESLSFHIPCLYSSFSLFFFFLGWHLKPIRCLYACKAAWVQASFQLSKSAERRHRRGLSCKDQHYYPEQHKDSNSRYCPCENVL